MFEFIVYIKNKKAYLKYGNTLSKFISKNVHFISGALGIGKTTLIKSIIGKKIKYKMLIKSPTYNIVESYKTIYHADLYRLKNIKNLHEINFSDYITNESLFLIEWGNKFVSSTYLYPKIQTYILNYLDTLNRVILLKSKFFDFRKIFG